MCERQRARQIPDGTRMTIERNKRLNVPLSLKEWKLVHRLAEEDGQSISNWVRQLIRAKAKAKAKLDKPRRRKR